MPYVLYYVYALYCIRDLALIDVHFPDMETIADLNSYFDGTQYS